MSAGPIAVRSVAAPAWLSARWLESAAAFAAAFAVALVSSAHLLRRDVVEGDALVHQFWMRRWVDPQLFTDSLTARLRGSERYPDGYQALFWLASHVADPIHFGEWLGIGLMAFAGWLIFEIVRDHTDWRPAAWLAAGLFLALQGHRFFGGFPRGFLHVVVLATVLLAMRGREWPAALVASGGALFYPPAALLAVGVLCVSALGGDRRRMRTAAVAAVLGAALVPLPSGAGEVLSASEARRYPEFGEHGDLHFFTSSLIEYLRQNRSGFDLRATGSLLLLAAVGLLVLRRGGLRREVLAMPVVSLLLWGLAQATLFHLYLPHRYTYPLLAFGAIALAVLLKPTWQALGPRGRVALAVAPVPLAIFAQAAFPLGPHGPVPLWLVALAVPAVLATCSPVVAGLVLLAALVAVPGRVPPGQVCPPTPAMEYLSTLPKTAVIAGDPQEIKCVPVSANRPVVISSQLAFSYERGYLHDARARMFDSLRAYYGPSRAALSRLVTRYGATHLLVYGGVLRRERAGRRAIWTSDREPYGALVQGLLRSGKPAVLHLPALCRRWRYGEQAIYDLRCL